MMKSYEAIYENESLQWLKEKPEINDGERVIVMVETPAKPAQDNIREVLDRAWGSLGSGQTLDEVDEEIRQVRERDWERDF